MQTGHFHDIAVPANDNTTVVLHGTPLNLHIDRNNITIDVWPKNGDAPVATHTISIADLVALASGTAKLVAA